MCVCGRFQSSNFRDGIGNQAVEKEGGGGIKPAPVPSATYADTIFPKNVLHAMAEKITLLCFTKLILYLPTH